MYHMMKHKVKVILIVMNPKVIIIIFVMNPKIKLKDPVIKTRMISHNHLATKNIYFRTYQSLGHWK